MTGAAPAVLRLPVPASKSVTHRALILASLAGVEVAGPLRGGDCDATLAGLQAMGASVEWAAGPGDRVRFGGAVLSQPGEIDCQNSGTSLRLLTALAAVGAFPVVLSGDRSLSARPNGPLLEALSSLGAAIGSNNGCAPIRVQGPVRPGTVRLDGSVSSQFASALLLALSQLDAPSVLLLEPPVSSRPYLELTQDVARGFGVEWHVSPLDGGAGLRFDIPAPQPPSVASGRYVVEGDWSSAAFPLVAAAVRSLPLELSGLNRESAQGDRALLDILPRFGLGLEWVGGELLLTPGPLRSPGSLNLLPTPDLFPALCALAACSPGRTRLAGAPSLRHKESDRIAAMAEGLRLLGVEVEELVDGLIVEGGGLTGAKVMCLGDHRVHMALALLDGVASGPVAVDDPGCVMVSYPRFHEHIAQIRAAGGAS